MIRKFFQCTLLAGLFLLAPVMQAQTVVVGEVASELNKHAGDPYGCDAVTEGHLYWNTTTKLKMHCNGTAWTADTSGSLSFANITAATNANALVISGSLEYTGPGTINANKLFGDAVDASGRVQNDFLCYDATPKLVPCKSGILFRTDSDGTVALLSTDRGAGVEATNATSSAVSIAQAGSAGFEVGYKTVLLCRSGAGDCTLTPTTSTIDCGLGVATACVIHAGQALTVVSETSAGNGTYLGILQQDSRAPNPLYVYNCSTTADCTTEANSSGTGGAQLTDDTSTTNEEWFSAKYTVPANFLTKNRIIEVRASFETITGASAPNTTIKLYWGGTGGTVLMALSTTAAISSANRSCTMIFTIQGTGAPSASVNVETATSTCSGVIGLGSTAQPVAAATNATKQIILSGQWSSNAANTHTIRLRQLEIWAR